MGHPRSKLTVFGRQLLVDRVAQGWPAAHVADQLGISRATAYKWVNRFKSEGEAGLADRSSRPHRSPRRLAPDVEAVVLAARAEWRYGPDRLGPLLGMAASTLSHHLDKLKNEGLVAVQREGTFLRCTANTASLEELLGFLYAECCTRNKAVEPRRITCC